MRGLSIDVGIHNLAIYIEEFDQCSLQDVCLPKEKKRYGFNNEILPNCREGMSQVLKNGKVIFMDKVNLSQKKGAQFDIQIFRNLTIYLDRIKDKIDVCSFVVIEEQLKRNPMAQRVEQHCISWVLINYLNLPIIRFPSRNKTNVLGAPKLKQVGTRFVKFKKNERKPFIKKWSCMKAKEILTLRGDQETIDFIFNGHKKHDDLSDVITQMNAFKIRCFIDKKLY
jgi:hypothetical protein